MNNILFEIFLFNLLKVMYKKLNILYSLGYVKNNFLFVQIN